MPVIDTVNGVKFIPGIKVRMRYPNMMGGYIQNTFVSPDCAEAYITQSGVLIPQQQRRAKIFSA